jgi:hypothetical protein
MIAIRSITNNKDGTSANVVLDGVPHGTLSFKACRLPDYSKAGAVTYTGSNGNYVLSLNYATLWYVWAVDSDGPSPSFAAVWIGLVNSSEMIATAEAVTGILTSHKAGIEAALNNILPKCTLKHIVFGDPSQIIDMPGILVTRPTEKFKYSGLAGQSLRDYALEIDFIFRTQDEVNLLPAATEMSSRIMQILNIPDYTNITISTGTPLAFCVANQGDADKEQIAEQEWIAAGSVLWSGEAYWVDMGVLVP